MTTNVTAIDSHAAAPHSGSTNFMNCSSGFWSWASTLDHKRIGVMYMAAVIAALIAGGLFALLIRIELLTPGPTIMDAASYNRVFTLHGMVMVFTNMRHFRH